MACIRNPILKQWKIIILAMIRTWQQNTWGPTEEGLGFREIVKEQSDLDSFYFLIKTLTALLSQLLS